MNISYRLSEKVENYFVQWRFSDKCRYCKNKLGNDVEVVVLYMHKANKVIEAQYS